MQLFEREKLGKADSRRKKKLYSEICEKSHPLTDKDQSTFRNAVTYHSRWLAVIDESKHVITFFHKSDYKPGSLNTKTHRALCLVVVGH
jgi:hypothetical protein